MNDVSIGSHQWRSSERSSDRRSVVRTSPDAAQVAQCRHTLPRLVGRLVARDIPPRALLAGPSGSSGCSSKSASRTAPATSVIGDGISVAGQCSICSARTTGSNRPIGIPFNLVGVSDRCAAGPWSIAILTIWALGAMIMLTQACRPAGLFWNGARRAQYRLLII